MEMMHIIDTNKDGKISRTSDRLPGRVFTALDKANRFFGGR